MFHSKHRVKAEENTLPPVGDVLCILCETFHTVIECALIQVFVGWKSSTADTLTHWVVQDNLLQQVPFTKQSIYPSWRKGYTCPKCWGEAARMSTTRFRQGEKVYEFFLAEIIRTPTTRSKEQERKYLEREATKIIRNGNRGLLVEKRRL